MIHHLLSNNRNNQHEIFFYSKAPCKLKALFAFYATEIAGNIQLKCFTLKMPIKAAMRLEQKHL
jgi:hypothetical protein